MDLLYDENGLIPVIVQDYKTKKVLTLAYMNKESLDISVSEKKTCFFSRSRNELWRKGETSGNYQHIVSITADCDSDALVIEVIKDGPACHTGEDSCFFNSLFSSDVSPAFSYENLYKLIEGRKNSPDEGSYTTYLFQKGIEKILKKVGEESTEVIIAGTKKNKEETIYEIADLAYHVLVLMAELGIKTSDITEELTKRYGNTRKVTQENPSQ